MPAPIEPLASDVASLLMNRASGKGASPSRFASAVALPSDAELVERARSGERWAQTALCRRHWRVTHHLACKLAGRNEAEDIVQDVFAHAFKSLNSLRDPDAFRAWVCAIVVRQARRQHRRHVLQQRVLTAYKHELARQAEQPAEAEAKLELKEVSEHLARMRARQRDALLLHRLEGRTRQETARAMGVSLSSVKRWVAQVDRRLKSVGD